MIVTSMSFQHSEMQWLQVLFLALQIPKLLAIPSSAQPPNRSARVESGTGGELEIRLVGPQAPCVGDLEVYNQGKWNSLCSHQWNSAIGKTVCRQIGCGSYDTVIIKTIISEERDILLDNFMCEGTEASLAECPSSASNKKYCETGATVNIFCQVTKILALMDGSSPCAGRLEAGSFSQVSSIICGRMWDVNEGRVLCKYLGCGDVVSASGNSQFGAGKLPLLQAEVHCNGTEDDPWKCERKALAHNNCSKEETAGVVCSGHRNPRLVGGYNGCSGRLEIQHGETWGTVCDSHWDSTDARVVCASLKCGDVISVLGGAYFGEGCGPVWQDSYECQGNENIIWECATTPRNPHNCTHRNDVSVICSGQKGPRLVGGTDACSGRVEILRGEIWGTVCDTYWDLQDAAVVCNQLNCGTVVSAPGGAFFGEGNGSIWQDINECRGNELSLSDCHIASWGHYPCTHKNDAGVICSAEPWQLRLADGESICDGRVEVYYSGVWGRVVDTSWNFRDADVVCRQLHCGAAVNAYNQSKYGTGKGPVLINDVRCNGSEPYLWSCPFTKPNQLSLAGDVGVACSDRIPIRLVDGGSRCAGRVELFYNGAWGTICDDSWDLTDANLICLELNCGRALNATGSSWFGQGSGPIWFNNMNCSASSSALRQCLSRPWSRSDCLHKEDAGVICSDHREIRLANGKNLCQGRLEVFFNGTWGTVCSDSFDAENADVVCAQLKCGSAASVENSAAFGEGSGPIWLDDVRCRADDSLLWQCPSSPWGQHNCNHGEDVGVICSELKPTMNQSEEDTKVEMIHPFLENPVMRLVAGLDNCSGRLEILYRETWGTVCDDSWDIQDATVVCRQLNCGDSLWAPGEVLLAQGNGTIWMDEVKCKGSELFLWDCQFSAMGHHDCAHKEDVGVICSGHQLRTTPFNYLRAFIFVIPFSLASVLVVVFIFLVIKLLRNFQKARGIWQTSAIDFREPFYEEIEIKEFGTRFDSHSVSSVSNVEYYINSDLQENEDANKEVSLILVDDIFGEEYDAID